MRRIRRAIQVGTAGWTIPRAAAGQFPGEGSHLQRYARVLPCAEINSSFYRPHAYEVYAKWAAQTPREFRFSVKLPRSITHEQRLRRARAPLESFLAQVAGLGSKLGPLLIQLPPSFEYDARVARTFFELLREQHGGSVVCEPRHASWFAPRAESLLVAYRIGRVAADPAKSDEAREPGGWLGELRRRTEGIAYYRLHGSPRMYWSRYSAERITEWFDEMTKLLPNAQVWCIFDNTASGAAIENALEIRAGQSTPAPAG